MKISEIVRWAIIRRSDGAVMCRVSRRLEFLDRDTLDGEDVALYRTKKIALANADRADGCSRDAVAAVRAIVSVDVIEEGTA